MSETYVAVRLENGLDEKGVTFTSTGIIFVSSELGFNYAKDYADLTRVSYSVENTRGLMKVEFIQDEALIVEEYPGVTGACWEQVHSFLESKAESAHVILTLEMK